MRLTDLADSLRAQGLTVVEHPGWEHRGREFHARPDTILAHHTATPAQAKGDLPTLRLLVEGRSDLPGPLSQLALSRSGVVHVLASGKANHAGKGAWRGQVSSSRTIGIEAEYDGSGRRWPQAQYDAYVRLCAALCRYLSVGPERVCGHREWALPRGRKVDPAGIDMETFRAQVRAALTPTQKGEEMTPAEWQRMERLIDDRVRILLRAERADGTATGHPNLRDITARLDALHALMKGTT